MDQITALRQQLTRQQYNQDIVDDISYAACALLDETVLLRNNGGYDVWQGIPLQVTFFKTYQAGDELFERIRQRIRNPEGAQLVLACYDRVLGRGFQGRYLSAPQAEREQLVMEVWDLLPSTPVNDVSMLNAFQGPRSFWRNTSLLFWTGASLVVVALLFWALRQHLNSTLVQLLQCA